jgi:hypothetical protein
VTQTYPNLDVRRWHSNPDLCHIVDPIGAHSARMMAQAMTYWPDTSREMLLAILYHDAHEDILGDIPANAPVEMRATRDKLAFGIDYENGWAFEITPLERRRLKFLDRLDAHRVAMRACHWLQRRQEWRESGTWLDSEAEALGVTW